MEAARSMMKGCGSIEGKEDVEEFVEEDVVDAEVETTVLLGDVDGSRTGAEERRVGGGGVL